MGRLVRFVDGLRSARRRGAGTERTKLAGLRRRDGGTAELAVGTGRQRRELSERRRERTRSQRTARLALGERVHARARAATDLFHVGDRARRLRLGPRVENGCHTPDENLERQKYWRCEVGKPGGPAYHVLAEPTSASEAAGND